MTAGATFARAYQLRPGIALPRLRSNRSRAQWLWAQPLAQYQALMAGSVTFARQFNLRPGIALSAAQMAQLTSDIVWLVERDITLADGSKTKALVPQVYVRVKDGDLTGDGALLSASAVNLNITSDLTNSGTIAGRTAVVLNAQNVHNLAGRIRGANVAVAATHDLNNIGGQIMAEASLTATAGRDLNVASTTSTQTGGTGNRTNIDRVAGLYVSNPGGTLVASAGRDINLIAAELINNAPTAAGQPAGSTTLVAGNNLNLGTVTEASNNTITWNAANFRKDGQSQEVGTNIQTAGNLQLSAGNDLTARAAQISSSEGALTVSAANSVNISAGQSSQSVDEGHQYKSKGFLSKKTTTTRETLDRTDAIGSAFSGNSVNVLAGQDINVKGSGLVSDTRTTLAAGNNLNIEAAQNTYASTSLRDEKKSGIFSGGGLSITAGTQQQSSDQQNTRTTAAASTVGAIAGDVSLQAGQAYKQVGSDVLAPGGDISITAKKVDIIEARETRKTVAEQKFSQSGLTLALTAPVITALQTAQQMSQAAGQTSDSRMQALAATTTALAAKNAYDSVAADPAAAGGLNISLTIGGSKSQSNSTTSSDLARGSTVAAGGDVSIMAAGAGQQSDLLVRGSTVQAGNKTSLIAEDEIKLLAAANTSQHERNSSGSSAGIGVALTIGSGGMGFGITANASVSQGKGEGQDTSWTHTRVEAGKQLNLLSGGDTTLKGAVAKAEIVKADVGGNLNIESLQDTSKFTSKDQSLGGSVTVGIGFSGSVNVSQQKINSDFASVMEQSGIKAGDGGFDVNVMGNTDLKGAVIASTDKAVQDGKNTFTTGTLSTSEIQNRAEFSASSLGLGGGYSDGKGLMPVGEQSASSGSPPPSDVGTDANGKAQTGAGKTPGSTLPGYNGFSATVPIALSASGDASSTTASGISAGAITINNDQKQQALTGKTAEQTVASIDTSVRSNADGSNALKPIFNEQEIKAGFEVAGALARETGTFLANRAKDVDVKRAQAEAAERQAADPNNKLTDNQRIALLTQAGQLRADAESLADNWGPGGTYRQITTALAAAAGGNVSAASGQFVQNMVANYVQQQGAAYVGKLVADGAVIEGSPAHAALQAMVACAGAAASGQSCASGAGGAAAASLLTNLFADSTPNETQAQKEAKRNLLISMVTGIAAVGGADAATAANAATSATDNNWLATQQKVQMTKDLDAATSLLDKAKITAKWTYVSGKQDVLTAQGIGKGLADAGWSDIKGMAEFLSDPAKGLAGLKEIINSPEARQQMGDVAFKELDAQIGRMQTALQIGGDQNAEQFGQDIGSLVWRVGGVVTGAGGLAKGSIALTKAGINVGVDGLQAMSGLGKFENFAAKGGLFAPDGKPLMDFGALSNNQKGVIGDVLGSSKVETLVPGAEKIGRAPGVGGTGIDDLYKSSRPGVDYVMVEYKFGSSVLKQTKDGLQMSDDWLQGSATGYNRLAESVGVVEAPKVRNAIEAGRVEKWLVHTDPFGNVTVGIIDKNGKILPNPQGASKILGGLK